MANILPVVLLVDKVRSLHNIGSLFRTAEGANIEEIILSEFSAIPPRPEIEKTALGATSSVRWQQVKSLKDYALKLKEQGYTLCALEQTDHSTNLFTTETKFPLALIIGHEREGVDPELLALCDLHIELPMDGTVVHSLNVSNATAITLYELRRRFCYS